MHAAKSKNSILRWYRTVYKDGKTSVEQRYSPLLGSEVVSNTAFASLCDVQNNKDRTPITLGYKACYFCKYFHRSANFCAVNPGLIGKGTKCLDREDRKYV